MVCCKGPPMEPMPIVLNPNRKFKKEPEDFKVHDKRHIVFGVNKDNEEIFYRWNPSTGILEKEDLTKNAKFYNKSGVIMRNEDNLIICGGYRYSPKETTNICGGYRYSPKEPTNICMEYSFSNNECVSLPSMIENRYSFPLHFTDNKAYAIGGRTIINGKKVDGTACEVFDYTKMEWEKIADMNQPRRNGLVYSYNNYIWVIYGIHKYRKILDSVERYKPNDNKWEKSI